MEISKNNRGTTIIYGNGLNRVGNNDCPSWTDLLTQLDLQSPIQSIRNDILSTPATIQYDLLELCSKLPPSMLLEQMCKKISGPWKNEIYERLFALRTKCNFLTTNYDLSLESYSVNKKRYGTEVVYNLYTYYNLCQETNQYGKVWHIHGNVQNRKSIILGYDHYCRQIARIRDYIPMQLRKVALTDQQKVNWKGESWINLFFSDDIYIIGLGLDFAELDLWWLIDLWARCKKNDIIRNKIVYMDVATTEKTNPLSKIFENYGMEYKVFRRQEYIEAYSDCLDELNTFLCN